MHGTPLWYQWLSRQGDVELRPPPTKNELCLFFFSLCHGTLSHGGDTQDHISGNIKHRQEPIWVRDFWGRFRKEIRFMIHQWRGRHIKPPTENCRVEKSKMKSKKEISKHKWNETKEERQILTFYVPRHTSLPSITTQCRLTFADDNQQHFKHSHRISPVNSKRLRISWTRSCDSATHYPLGCSS